MVSRSAVFAVSTGVIMATGAMLAKLTGWDLKYRMPEPRAMPPVRPSIASVTTEVFLRFCLRNRRMSPMAAIYASARSVATPTAAWNRALG